MADLENKRHPYGFTLVGWSHLCADVVEDLARALIGFVSNGLDLIYGRVLKSLPILGKVFTHRWVEQVLKLCSGITIGQGLASDIGYYVFRPIGFFLGAGLGLMMAFSQNKSLPTYRNQISKFLYRLSGQTVAGMLFGVLSFAVCCQFFDFSWADLSKSFLLCALIGAGLGLMAKALVMMAVNSVNSANAAAVRKTVQRARDLNQKLQKAAKLRAKSRVLMHAQDIIQQMNGPQPHIHLEEFFNAEYEAISYNTNKKIERHFNYLSDRACHGDMKAFKRLQELIPSRLPAVEGGKNPFEVMMERIFNARAIFKLKEDVDMAYDRWQYHFLCIKKE